MAQDPFQNPFVNVIFNPIKAADRLCVLRKDKKSYDIFMTPKDFKVFNKDKRDVLLSEYDETADQAYLEADADAAEAEEVDEA